MAFLNNYKKKSVQVDYFLLTVLKKIRPIQFSIKQEHSNKCLIYTSLLETR